MEFVFSDKLAALKPSAIREIFKSLTDPTIISFAAGNPAAESFPVADLQRLANEIFEQAPVAALQYSITEGYPPLRAAVEQRVRAVFGIGKKKSEGAAFDDETVIVSGGQQGIELCCKALCNEGDVVICENPSFIGALNAFRSCGAKTVGVELHEDGIDPDELEAVIAANPRAKLLYLIPTFQNPAGLTMSEQKRRRVYEVARRHSLPILEDNPYGELRFAGQEIPTIKSMDDEGLVIYCSSFSKILSAGMRVGYVVAPAEIVSKMVVAKQSEDVHTNIFFQMLCHRFMTECDLDAHIEKIRAIYRHKCGLMLGELDKKMPNGVTYTRPEGGLFIWCTLPEGADMLAFCKLAVEKKVAVVPGTTFGCDPSAPSRSFRLNYSTPSDEQIVEGVARLSDAARAFLQ